MQKDIVIDEMLISLGRNISAIRNAKRETQFGVAKSIGVTHPVVSKIENGSYNITIELLVKLCNHFKITLQQVMDLDNNQIFYFTQKNITGNFHKQYVVHELADGYDILIKQLQSEVTYLRKFYELHSNKNSTLDS
ncbi:MAG: helix-turn-helix transcriptional regulator [Ferruginibacter sp.]